MSALGFLDPQQLTDQMEGLGPDVDIESLSLVFEGKDGFALREMITGGDITRTIEGASTLSIDVFDRDRALVTSGLLGADVDVLIDDLWFRLVAPAKQGDSVSLVFEDREVAILRDYPDRGNPKAWPLLRSVAKLPKPPQGRAVFAKILVDEAVKGSGSPIRFVCPALPDTPPAPPPPAGRPDPPEKRQQREPGFAPGVKITVQLVAATAEQIKNTERVLDVGYRMGASIEELVWSVMTINDESGAIPKYGFVGSCANNGRAVGIFQQCPGGTRPDGGGAWPASFDIEQEAHAWFEVAAWVFDRIASGALPPLTAGAACSEIQRDATWHTDHQGSVYARYEGEARNTVAAYLAGSGYVPPPSAKPRSKESDDALAVSQNLTFEDTLDTAQHFYRGVPAKPRWRREDNWTCLKRIADEVRWRCFVVSGTVYFISEPDLFRSAPAMTISERTDGVEGIDWRYDVGQHNAQVTVTARASRWQAPPGTVVILEDSGPVDGRWIVSTIRRPIFDTVAQITLKKPRPVLPESRAPEYGAGSGSGVTFHPKKPKPRQPKPQPPVGGNDLRNRIVEVAMKALGVEQKWHYHYIQLRPYPPDLFSAEAHDPGIDCSAFVHLVYKEAGAPDPSGYAFDGQGNTCSIWGHCRHVDKPGLGDLILYADPCHSPHAHVGIEVGSGLVVEIGSDNGILLVQANYRTDVWGYATVFPEGQ